jgi:Do/DeqQ family serine protease
MFRMCVLVLALSLANLGGASAADRNVPSSRDAIHLSFAPVVKKAAPAVVNVFSRRVVRTTLGPGSLFSDPLFRRFFGDELPFGMPRERIEASLGSGVILDPGGLIVTNHHVIAGADQIHVVLADRREFEAKLVLDDERSDLAVMKIDAPGDRLPVLEVGDSDQLEVGDLVLAIGNPFGVGQTVTSGIVSGLGRSIGTSDFGSFIQTDAAINPGNSGGALVDLDGRLIGINSAIFSQSGGSVGIGFAIPSSLVKSVLEAARHGGHVARPWLGASGQPVTPELARNLRLSHPEGVLIKDIAPRSPAQNAGLRIGDVILSVNGHDVGDPEELRFRLATLPIDGHAELAIWRSGARTELSVALMAPPDSPPRDLTTMRGREPLAGATVGNLNPAFAEELGLDSAQSGVIVKDVAANSIAAQIGLQAGDVLTSVNDRDIESVADLKTAVAMQPPWRISVRRGDKQLSVTIGG